VLRVFIKCPKCGQRDSIPEIAATRADLAMFRGSESHVACGNCEAVMDAMTAFCGEQVGSNIVRREDPEK
jgi:uncharacterized Zn finger protein